MNKTAIVFPNSAKTEDYRKKTAKFLEYYSQPEVLEALGLESTKDIWIIDNASKFQEDYLLGEEIRKNQPYTYWNYSWKRYHKYYDRPSHLSYSYCWRALYFGRELFQEYDYDKILHLNNDSFLLSKNIMKHIKNIPNGKAWMPYCPKHNFPECDINVYTKDFEGYWELTAKPYAFWTGQAMENVLKKYKWDVEKNWIGDRWAEYPKDIPPNADFATQVRINQEIRFNG